MHFTIDSGGTSSTHQAGVQDMQGMQPPEEKGSLTYIKGGALIDGNGGAPLKDPVIAVQGRRITEVGTRDEIRIPRDANVIDAGRCVLMPGMMDLHIHTS
ncbi:MAG TPA: hypothetical protein VFZ14_18575, partial [Burkholderiales bacterium]|nr:hypothetical protein [Burkholderiales bacterium]